MKIHAVVFDIYNTLLMVGGPPTDADEQWRVLFREFLGSEPTCGRVDFAVSCSRVIARWHATARATGIAWPEIQWPMVVAEVIPTFTRLSAEAQAEFVLRQIKTGHTTALPTEAANALRQLNRAGCRLGIASNAQAYSQHELSEGLAAHGLGTDLFEPALCFWSFEHGFSKPDPHVFRILTARLEARGLSPDTVLMVGDRLDNDIEPARLHGWRTFQIGGVNSLDRGAEWGSLLKTVIG